MLPIYPFTQFHGLDGVFCCCLSASGSRVVSVLQSWSAVSNDWAPPLPGGKCIGYQWGSVSALKQTFKVLSRECRSDVALVHLWMQSLQSWDAISNDCDWHPTTEQDGRKSVIVLRNRSCLHYCALTASVLVITAIFKTVGCYHLYSDLEILYCSTDLICHCKEKSAWNTALVWSENRWAYFSVVPKEMSIELINWKKKFQHIVQPGRTSGMVAIGRSGSTTK